MTQRIKDREKELKNVYGNDSLEQVRQELEKEKSLLEEKEKKFLESDYKKKSGINTEYGLKEVLEELKNSDTMTELLENDKKLKDDPLQYDSPVHGVSHTRRVAFLATLIMNSEKISNLNDRELIRQIVNNHDIGRTNDWEDKEHGAKSVQVLEEHPERLKEIKDKDKKILEFVIKEHSLSAKENETDLHNEFEDGQENVKKILAICKDADKLDRVRLDPKGMASRDGLDINHLSLESSKKLENVAYEGLDKILSILDIEYEKMELNEKMKQIDSLICSKKECTKFEEKWQEAQENMQICRKEFLQGIVKGKRFQKILEVPKKIKEHFLVKHNGKTKNNEEVIE